MTTTSLADLALKIAKVWDVAEDPKWVGRIEELLTMNVTSPVMTIASLQNVLRILVSIDLHELKAEGVFSDARLIGHKIGNHAKGVDLPEARAWHDWCKFRDDPFRFFLRCDDDTAKRIWSIIIKRQAGT